MLANDVAVVEAAVRYSHDAGVAMEILRLVPTILVP